VAFQTIEYFERIQASHYHLNPKHTHSLMHQVPLHVYLQSQFEQYAIVELAQDIVFLHLFQEKAYLCPMKKEIQK